MKAQIKDDEDDEGRDEDDEEEEEEEEEIEWKVFIYVYYFKYPKLIIENNLLWGMHVIFPYAIPLLYLFLDSDLVHHSALQIGKARSQPLHLVIIYL